MIAVRLRGGYAAAEALTGAVHLFTHAVSLGGVDDDIRFGRAESGSAKQDQGEAEVTKQHAAILPDSPLAWPSLAASFADCLAALAKNARQKPGPVVWHGACF